MGEVKNVKSLKVNNNKFRQKNNYFINVVLNVIKVYFIENNPSLKLSYLNSIKILSICHNQNNVLETS